MRSLRILVCVFIYEENILPQLFQRIYYAIISQSTKERKAEMRMKVELQFCAQLKINILFTFIIYSLVYSNNKKLSLNSMEYCMEYLIKVVYSLSMLTLVDYASLLYLYHLHVRFTTLQGLREG